MEEDTLVGPGTSIGESSTLTSSVVGANCKIGNNVSLKNSIVLSGVVIEENCQLDGVVVGNGVKLEVCRSAYLRSWKNLAKIGLVFANCRKTL